MLLGRGMLMFIQVPYKGGGGKRESNASERVAWSTAAVPCVRYTGNKLEWTADSP